MALMLSPSVCPVEKLHVAGLETVLVVGIGHKARHGKDTLARYIHALAPEETMIAGFSSPLKTFCAVMGWMQRKDARLLQLVGTDIFRERVDQDFWVKILAQQIANDIGPAKIVLIPDMRFPNEAQFCDYTICIDRVESDGAYYVAGDRDPQHPSEVALNDYPFDLRLTVQSGDLETLRIHASALVTKLLDLHTILKD